MNLKLTEYINTQITHVQQEETSKEWVWTMALGDNLKVLHVGQLKDTMFPQTLKLKENPPLYLQIG